MSYDLGKLPIQSLLRPISEAAVALTRLDERIARSPVGKDRLLRGQGGRQRRAATREASGAIG